MLVHLKKLDSSNTKNLTEEGIKICNRAQLEIVLLDAPLTIEELKQAVEAPGLTFLATSEELQALKDWQQFKQELEDLGIYKEVSFLTFDAIEVPDCYSTGKLVLPERVVAIREMVDVIDPCTKPTCYSCDENNRECSHFIHCSILYDNGYRKKEVIEKQTAAKVITDVALLLKEYTDKAVLEELAKKYGVEYVLSTL